MAKSGSEKVREFKPLTFFLRLLFIVLVAVGACFLWLSRDKLSDLITSLGYEPSAKMQAIESSLQLTGDAERIFRASRPELENETSFNEHCDSHDRQISVLGCYANRRIYLYDVSDNVLTGVKESTAAHELLHAVWTRLGSDEKSEIGKTLTSVYNNQAYHDLLASDLEIYDEPDLLDELHSRIGTEIKDLPAALENHYAKYFTDQDKIVEFYDEYSMPFKELQQELDDLSGKMADLKVLIDQHTSAYENRSSGLNSAINEFNSCANTLGCFASDADFNARRAALVSEQSAIEALYNTLDQEIEDYNALVKRYNANVLKGESLDNIINSNSKVKENL